MSKVQAAGLCDLAGFEQTTHTCGNMCQSPYLHLEARSEKTLTAGSSGDDPTKEASLRYWRFRDGGQVSFSQSLSDSFAW